MSPPDPEPLRRLLLSTGLLDAVRERGRAWLVGGAVRDLLLGREVRDIDLLVAGEPAELARRLGGRVTAFFPLAEEFGQYRMILAGAASPVVCDLSRLTGSLEADLARRDLTINAMAVDLATFVSPSQPEVIDPLGGRSDLASRVARMVAPEAFSADPLRLLRTCRLAATLGLSVEDATAEAMRRRAPLLAGNAAERVRDELVLLAAGMRLREGLRVAERLGLLPSLVPEAEAMAGTAQDGYHHLNVWEHTMEAIRWFEELARGGWELLGDSGGTVAAALRRDVVPGRPGMFVVALAILYHDVGKVGTAAVGADGRLHFHGHPARGAAETAGLGTRLALSTRELDAIRLLVVNHLRPGLLLASGNITARAVHRLLRDAGEWLPHLAALAWCDFLASRGPLSRDRDLEGARRFTAELVQAFHDRQASPPPPVPVDGRALMVRLGLPPGPHLSRIREELAEEMATVGPMDKEGAVRLAARLVERERWGRIRALVFDFDNTVAPTFPAIIEAFTAAQRAVGATPLPPGELVRLFGPPEEALIRGLVGDELASRGIEAYHAAHARSVRTARLSPGVLALLEAARVAGLRTALLTGRSRRTLEDYLRALGIGPLFDVTLAGDETTLPKPDPEGLLRVIERLGVPASQVALVGDSPIDMAVAAKVGALPLAAVWDSVYRRELLEGPARILFLRPEDLKGWLEGLKAT